VLFFLDILSINFQIHL